MGPNNEKWEKKSSRNKSQWSPWIFFKRSCQREPKLKMKQPTILKDNHTRKKKEKKLMCNSIQPTINSLKCQ